MVKPRVNQATIAGSVKTIALKEDNFVVFNLTVPYKKFEFNIIKQDKDMVYFSRKKDNI